jgi:hypothetical protein
MSDYIRQVIANELLLIALRIMPLDMARVFGPAILQMAKDYARSTANKEYSKDMPSEDYLLNPPSNGDEA